MGKRIVISNGEQELSFDIEFEMMCGFCQNWLYIGYTADENRNPTILHKHPPCPDYLVIEGVAEFLAANRRKLGIPDPPAENN